MKFHLVEVVAVAREIHGFSGDGAESVVMAVVAFIKDLGASG